MLSCKDVTELVTDYLEGRMTLRQRMGLHFHLGMCGRCRTYLRQMKLTVATLGRLPAEPVPADVKDELVKRLAGFKGKA